MGFEMMKANLPISTYQHTWTTLMTITTEQQLKPMVISNSMFSIKEMAAFGKGVEDNDDPCFVNSICGINAMCTSSDNKVLKLMEKRDGF
jgi:hypothetical protein